MIELEPKAAFHKQEETLRQYRSVIDSGWMKHALMLAMADYALRGRPTEEQLVGARNFLVVMLNFGEIETEPSRQTFQTLSQVAAAANAKAATKKPTTQP